MPHSDAADASLAPADLRDVVDDAGAILDAAVADNGWLREGEIDPQFNKKVADIIIQTRSYKVYLDEEMFVYWSYGNMQEVCEHFDKVLTRVAYLESLPIGHLSRDVRRSF